MNAAQRAHARRSGILGGTFDPPHLAHLALASVAREALRLNRVVFVPAGDPWRKADHPVTPAADRLALVRAAVADLPWAEVSTIEVEHSGPSYTADTVEALAADGEAWWFLLGADALHDMPHWHEPRRIIEAVRLAVARRPEIDGPLVTPALREALPGIEARIDEVPLSPMEISASEIRARIRAGGSSADVVDEAVRVVIDARGLYR